MRKLLFAGQARGQGQSTTALNFAAAGGLSGSKTLLIGGDPGSDLPARLKLDQHPDQASLNEIGLADFGRLYRGVLPNVDLLWPYEAEHTAVAQLDEVIAKLQHGWFEKYAWCLIDAPPLSELPTASAVKAADELIFVFAPDAEAAERLPGFLDLMARTEATNRQAMVRGVLLNRATAGASDEHEGVVRDQLARKALPLTIPFDPAQAQETGKPIVYVNPGAPSAQVWQELAEALGVARPSSAILMGSSKSGSALPSVKGMAGSSASKSGTALPAMAGKTDPLKMTPPPPPRTDWKPAAPTAPPAAKPRRPVAPNMSGEFKIDAAMLDSMLGIDQGSGGEGDGRAGGAGAPGVPGVPARKPPQQRRNEARSFLDLETSELPPSGLDDRPSARLPHLEEHIAAHRPAPRAMPAPRAPAVPAAPPPPRAPSRPGSSPKIELKAKAAAAAEAWSRPRDDATALWWVVGIMCVVAVGLCISYLGMKAADAGKLHIFVATLLGIGVTALAFVFGLLFARK